MADKLVKMRNDDGLLADVHPDEVDNYRMSGFRAIYDEDDAKAQAGEVVETSSTGRKRK